MKRLIFVSVAFAAWAVGFSACSSDEGDGKAPRGGAASEAAAGNAPSVPAGGAGGDPAASGGAAGDSASPDGAPEPSLLRVEFEELELEGEPAFITDFAFYPGSETDFLALTKSGRLLRYRLGERGATLVSERPLDRVHDDLDCGAISLAFEPDFAEGRYVYVGSCVSPTHSEVTRLDLDEALDVVPGTEVAVIGVGSEEAQRPWHNVGSIGFEPSGIMWALFGDKSLGAPAQDPASPLGKLLRFYPSRIPGLGGFESPDDAPLRDGTGTGPSVYALGLRSPFRGTLDSRGRYWIADVGSDEFEEIDVTREPGQNFGWPDREGPCAECEGTTPPTFSWEHGSGPDYIADDEDVETTLGRVAWVGPEVLPHEPDRYDGRLAGSVLFGDYCAGFIRQGRVDEMGVPTLDAPLGHLNNASSFRQHTDGFVYAMTFGRCQTDVENRADEDRSRLFRMVPKR